jgi:hypothetical protein
MRARPAALLLAATAAVVYFGLALPARRAAADLGDEYRRIRERRREAAQRLSRTEREGLGRLVRRTQASTREPPTDALMSLRRSVLKSIQASGVSNVRLSVNPGRGPVAGTVHLSAEGRFDEVVSLSGAVAPPGSGIVLARVRISPAADTIALDLDALSLGEGP